MPFFFACFFVFFSVEIKWVSLFLFPVNTLLPSHQVAVVGSHYIRDFVIPSAKAPVVK